MQRFSYDADGKVIGVNYNGTYYYCLRNAQGDIVKLIDKNGNAAVEYTYDTWGKLLSTSGSLAYTLGKNNPFRYRGYIYDEETGFYYLQSRYYDPEVRRFISADVYLSTGQGVLGHNAYAYCLNNPVNRSDKAGTISGINIIDFFRELAEGAGGGSAGGQPHGGDTTVPTASLPKTGNPNSSQTLPNPNGTPKQKRWYGPDGNAERDRDYNHPGNMPFPHDHEWNNGIRGKDHLPPSPDYEFSWEPVVGICIVTICAIGMMIVVADDATGIGIIDDFLFGPLGVGLEGGLIMIFG